MFTLLILFWSGLARAEDLGQPVIPVAALSAIVGSWTEGTHAAVALEKAEQVRWEEPAPDVKEPIADEPMLVHAFLIVDAKAVPLNPQTEMRRCKDVRKERLALKARVQEIGRLRVRMTAAVRKYAELLAAGEKSAAQALGKKIDVDVVRWNDLVAELNSYATKEEAAEPDRMLEYKFELFGKKGRDLQEYHSLLTAPTPIRARYGQHIWYDYTQDMHRIVEGFLEEPWRTDTGIWLMRRELTATKACTTNLGFSFEFGADWMNQEGARIPVVIRAHSWVYN